MHEGKLEIYCSYCFQNDAGHIFCAPFSSANHTLPLPMQGSTILFLHGFLGSNEEWVPIMHAISGSARCISVDLPGHGATKIKNCGDGKAALRPPLSIEIIADLLLKLIQHVTPDKVTLVGYSMGARIALYMALKFSDKVNLWSMRYQ